MSTNEDIPVVEAEPVENASEEEESKEHKEEETESSEPIEETEDIQELAGEFMHSFSHGFVQAPIDGVREIVNTLSGTKIVPKVEVIKKPEKKEIATTEWNVQKVGSGCGLIASLIVIGNMITKGRPL